MSLNFSVLLLSHMIAWYSKVCKVLFVTVYNSMMLGYTNYRLPQKLK